MGASRIALLASRGASGARSERGVTLVELLVAMALLGALMAGIVTTWQASGSAYLYGSEVADLQQTVRIGHDRMIREIRMAGQNPCDLAPPGGQQLGVTAVSATSITIGYYTGTTDCTAAPSTWQAVTYSLASNTLRRDDGGGPMPLTDATVSALNFQTFQCNGTAPTSVVDIARVTVQLDTRQTIQGALNTRRLVADVRLRNKSCSTGM